MPIFIHNSTTFIGGTILPQSNSSEYSNLYAIAAVAAMLPPHGPQHHHRPSPADLTELERAIRARGPHPHQSVVIQPPPNPNGNSSMVAAELRQSLHAYQVALAAAAERAREEEMRGLNGPTNGGGHLKGANENGNGMTPKKSSTISNEQNKA